MSTNKTVISSVVKAGGSQAALTKALMNANEVAKKIDPKKAPKKKN